MRSTQLVSPSTRWGAWWHDAACKGMSQDAFFGTDDEQMSNRMIVDARRVCFGCPVLAQCLSDSFYGREPHGIWAGTTGRERMRMIASHRRIEDAIADGMRIVSARMAAEANRKKGRRRDGSAKREDSAQAV